MEKEERKERAKVIANQHKDFVDRLKPFNAKKYRASLLYEDSLVKEDGKAYVNVDLTKIDSPFSVFSYDKRMDPDIFDYINRQVYYLRASIPVVINFDDGGKYSEELKEKVKKYVTRYYTLEYEDKRIENTKSNIFGGILLLIGLVALLFHFFIAGGMFGVNSSIFSEVTLIMSWMLIWQAMDAFFISGHSRRVEIYNSGQLALAEVRFGPAIK